MPYNIVAGKWFWEFKFFLSINTVQIEIKISTAQVKNKKDLRLCLVGEVGIF